MDSIFFILSKILTVFLFPMPLFFLMAMVSFFSIKGCRNRIYFLTPILFLYFFSNFFISQFLIASLESQFKPIPIETLPISDTAIVLGGMIQTISIQPGRPELTESADRLVDAARIYKAGKVKKILFTGGSGLLFANDYKEADLAKTILLDLGVKEEDILLENESRNTYENAVESAKILKTQNNQASQNILITSASHFKRAAGCFQKQSVTFVAYPTDYRGISNGSPAWELYLPSAGFLELSTIAIKEWVGIFVYGLRGYL
ncbi:YdcF family protein [Leptospira sp. 96542]|nr:YdcF family protein [Leptospira sp. 96542]